MKKAFDKHSVQCYHLNIAYYEWSREILYNIMLWHHSALQATMLLISNIHFKVNFNELIINPNNIFVASSEQCHYHKTLKSFNPDHDRYFK